MCPKVPFRKTVRLPVSRWLPPSLLPSPRKKVKANLAMTGEITLRGKVLPVGGIKEKILAAKRAGIKEIILSDENRKNIEEIQDIYLKGLTFHYVKDIKEVFAIALTDEKVADAIDLSVKKEKTEKKEE